MAGDSESRFGFLAGFIACVLILALTVMAFGPSATPTMFQPSPIAALQVEMPKPVVPLPTETPSFAVERTV